MTDPRVAAVEDNLVALFELMTASGVVTRLPDDDVVAYVSDVAFPLFNAVCGARFARGAEATRAATLVDGYLARGLPFMWWATPSHLTPEIDAAIRSRGIQPEAEPGMYVPLEGPVDPGTVAGLSVDDEGVTAELIEVMVQGFGFPDLVTEPLTRGLASLPPEAAFHVVARLDGAPVGAGSGFLTGRTLGIYNIATLGPARRRGVGYAVTATLMNLGRERGCTEAVLMASTMGRPTYERLGFVEVCQTPQYVWAPPS